MKRTRIEVDLNEHRVTIFSAIDGSMEKKQFDFATIMAESANIIGWHILVLGEPIDMIKITKDAVFVYKVDPKILTVEEEKEYLKSINYEKTSAKGK